MPYDRREDPDSFPRQGEVAWCRGDSRRLGLALLSLPLILSALPLPGQESPVFPAGVDVVTVDAVVKDKKGHPVAGLLENEFLLSEDGVPQTISSFQALVVNGRVEVAQAGPRRSEVSTNAPGRVSRSFLIVFDDAHLTHPQGEKTKEQLINYLKTGLAEGDEVTVIPTAGGAWWTSEMPEGYEDLIAFLGHLKGSLLPDFSAGHITDYEAMRLVVYRDTQVGAEVLRRLIDADVIPEPPNASVMPMPTPDMGQPMLRAMSEEIYRNATARNNLTLHALERAAAAVTSAKGRKTVILVSPGFPYDSTLSGFREAIEACRRANAAIYFLDARGLTGLPPGADAERGAAIEEQDLGTSMDLVNLEADGARSLAADSGGLTFDFNDIGSGLRRIEEESRTYYLIGYRSTNSKRDGKFRKIKVAVKTPGLEVRARKGYYAPSDTAKPKPLAPGELDPQVRAALDSPFESDMIPLRLASYVLGPNGATKNNVVLVAEADPRSFAFHEVGSRSAAALESYVLVTSRDKGTNEPQQKLIDLSLPPEVKKRLERSWLPILRTFTLEPGTYEASLLIRDRSEGGKTGTVRHLFTVPTPGSFRTTTAILTDQVDPGPGGVGTRPVPLAHREFPAGARLLHFFEVYGATPDPKTHQPSVDVSYTLRRADGANVATVGPTAIAPGPLGELSQQMVLPLDRVTPGNYELAVTVRDAVANESLELRDSFVVVPAS